MSGTPALFDAGITIMGPRYLAELEEKFREVLGSEDVFFDGFKIERILKGGEEVDLGSGWRVQVIATPGHTRDGLSYYVPRVKGLIIGEAAGVPDRNGLIHPEFLASYKDYVASLKKLLEFDVEIMMIAHHYVFTGEDARGYLSKSFERTQTFRARIEDYLKQAGGKRDAVVGRIFKEDY
jgi:glyoxylase-like metal-dependent hydrolase (beta-lactamase superfamily II)